MLSRGHGGASDRELEPGDTLGPYRLEEVLGEGGMGLVFKARRDGDDRPVALKVLKRQLSGDLIFQQRFRQEARAAAEVRDPHLVAILESAEWDGRHYLASDYVDGGSLTDRIASGGPLQLADVVRVIAEVGAGLDALHAAGVMHRDIKPSNVLFDSDGTAHADRLRPREGTGVHRPDPAGTGDGDARLPRARADPGQAGDAGDRHLRARLRRVRVRRRPGAVRRQVAPSRSGSPTSRSRRRDPVRRAPGAARRASPPRSSTALEKDPEQRPATAARTRACCAPPPRRRQPHDAGARVQRRAARRPARRGRRGARHRPRGRGPDDRRRGDLAPPRGRPPRGRRDRDRGPRLDERDVRERRYGSRRATRLAGGDTVKLGRSVLQVESVRAAATVASPPSPAPPAPAPPAPAAAPAGQLGPGGRRSAPTRARGRKRSRGIASRQLGPQLVSFAIVVATAVALALYFADH